MKLSELQRKDIVDIRNGKKIGKIIDVIFDPNIFKWWSIYKIYTNKKDGRRCYSNRY